MPMPSPRTKPSARLENALQRPSVASMPALPNPICACGDRIVCTPPTSAMSASPQRRLTSARCIATSDDEQAVSTGSLGPCRSSRWLIRFSAIDGTTPRNELPSIPSPACLRKSA
ncbi:Uncharacterised protein [Burkholderia pseudomallei]|nr:hypothetical protein DP56_6239 [Burkholderia pseudomallei]KGS27128.1 hypothetical protein X962_1020 [Burkholderia pseudomallei MSHR7343]KGS30817.1 hypothetical protein X941_620 [Burkholderia pseudomallei MSHR5569]KGS71621.1 hypothetical protein X990_2080 [Burkholderia pseudomallei MSHR4868]KGX64213.1 hypothetical protein Y024_1945 [Burkholderia pseudomallei TSV44]KGX66077.1 hypothetical protein Y027_1383 [Burkholderia pseudomallei TSV5]KOT25796.1 hypothetical protein DM52_4982 [Burkholderi